MEVESGAPFFSSFVLKSVGLKVPLFFTIFPEDMAMSNLFNFDFIVCPINCLLTLGSSQFSAVLPFFSFLGGNSLFSVSSACLNIASL